MTARFAFAGDRQLAVDCLSFLLESNASPEALLVSGPDRATHDRILREMSGLPSDRVLVGKEFREPARHRPSPVPRPRLPDRRPLSLHRPRRGPGHPSHRGPQPPSGLASVQPGMAHPELGNPRWDPNRRHPSFHGQRARHRRHRRPGRARGSTGGHSPHSVWPPPPARGRVVPPSLAPARRREPSPSSAIGS